MLNKVEGVSPIFDAGLGVNGDPKQTPTVNPKLFHYTLLRCPYKRVLCSLHPDLAIVICRTLVRPPVTDSTVRLRFWIYIRGDISVLCAFCSRHFVLQAWSPRIRRNGSHACLWYVRLDMIREQVRLQLKSRLYSRNHYAKDLSL